MYLSKCLVFISLMLMQFRDENEYGNMGTVNMENRLCHDIFLIEVKFEIIKFNYDFL